MKTKLYPHLILFLLLFLTESVSSQCPIGDPTMNGPAWNPALSIEENFNMARRWEEINRGLEPFCLGFFDAPVSGWDTLQKEIVALTIHNEERLDRGLLRLLGWEAHLTDVAQGHSNWQIENDVFSHTGDPALGSGGIFTVCPAGAFQGSTPFERINSDPALNGCWQSAAENIAVSVAFTEGDPSLDDFVARSIYNLMYRDAGSAWGHRHNILMVYNNDFGSPEREGFIGVGVRGGPNFQATAFGCVNWAYAMILTLDYYDPAPNCDNFIFVGEAPLPVELVDFRATEHAGKVRLNWTTESEVNSDFFAVERSFDGKDFKEIGQVVAAGFSQEALLYDFEDVFPQCGINYYRLRQVDFDGKTSLSNTVAVNLTAISEVEVFPNPFAGQLWVKIEDSFESTSEIELIDQTGQVIRSQTVSSDEGRISLSALDDLEKGVYFLRIIEPGSRHVVKVLKQ